VLDHQVGEAKGERAVRTRPQPQPDIRLTDEARTARIDHDQPHAPLLCGDRGGGVRQAGAAGVIAPQDQAAGLGDVRHGPTAGADAADAVDIAGGTGTAPAAHIHIGEGIGRAEGAHQPLDEPSRIRDRSRGGGREAKGHGFRPILVRDPAHGGSGQIERRVPADPFPAWISLTLWAGAPQRMCQPFRVIDEFRRRPPLGAERLTSWVRGVGVKSGEAAIFHRRHCATARPAEGAIAVNALRAIMISHHVALPFVYW
jgi:hypothetical protein